MKYQYNFFSPEGKQIIGEVAVLKGMCCLEGFGKPGRSGKVVPKFSGETEVDWDSQKVSGASDGDVHLICDSAGVWLLSQCTLKRRPAKVTAEWETVPAPKKGWRYAGTPLHCDSP